MTTNRFQKVRENRGLACAWALALLQGVSAWAQTAAEVPAPQRTPAASAQVAPRAGNLPRRPFLGIDSKAHTDEAFYIVLSPDDKRAVTAGYDGTVRVWDVQSGELIQRFFLPKGSSNGSRLRGLAMSPDGQRVAVTGYDMRRSIVLLSLQTGRIERVIQAPEDTITLAWSQDGRYIAAGKPGRAPVPGVRVFSAGTGAEVFRDAEFPADVTGLEFRADGTLFASSWDGKGGSVVKLYKPEGNGFRMVASKVPRYGDYRSHWDFEGKTITLGSSTRLDGATLEELPFELDKRSLPPNVFFARAMQSPDGKVFFGTTWSFHQPHGYLRRWTGTRRTDSSTQLKLPDPKIADIAITRKGEVIYLSEQGVVGMVDSDFKLSWRVAHDVARLDRQPDALKVTESGMVSLPVNTEEGEREVAFNLAAPEFIPAARVRESWKSPATSGNGVSVLAWEGTQTGTVNNVRLPLVSNTERSMSVAVHSTDGTVAVGTNWERLYKVSSKGERLWVKYLGSDVVGVNLIESRDLVVAATANGMLWLFRWSSGESVMSYYLQPASRRWIVISSAGYYEASTGAEDLAGWIVNPSSQRVADFMPMSRFRATLLLSGLGQKVWESRKESEAIKALLALRPAAASGAAPVPAPVVPVAPPETAGAPETPPDNAVLTAAAVRLEELPPRIELIAPGYQVSSESRQIRVRFKALSSAQAPVTQVRTMLASGTIANRNLVVGAKASGEDERELTVDIPAEDTEIRLIAENRFGASVPTVIRVSYTGPKQQAGKGNLYLLAAGVSKYDNPDYNLGLASKDAHDFVETLMRQRGALYAEVHVRQLLDKDASKSGVEAGFQWLKQNMTPRDTAIVFFAGHGFNDGPLYYFMTRDADLQRLAQTAMPFNLIRTAMTSLPGRALIFVDTCHSGNVIGKVVSRQARDATNAINDLASSENGLVVFASSTGSQFSQENPAWGNGAFTKAVVEGLLGAADFKKRGRITYKGLDAYVSDRVDELTKGEQTPVTPVLQGVPDFAIAEVRR